MGVPMMVDSDWLAAVDAFVRANAEGVPAPVKAADSRFYDVRPIYVRTSWTWDNNDKIWKSKMNFIARDAPTNSVYDVCAPTFSSANTPTASGRAFAVWRGRWELLDRPGAEYSGGDGINVDNVSGVITNTGIIDAIISVTGTSDGTAVNDGSTLFFAEDDFRVGSRDTDGGRAPCVALSAKRVISLVAGDNIVIESVQNPGFRQYTISAVDQTYVWPGMPITIGNVSGYLATSINTGSGGAYSPVTFDGKALVFRNLSEIEVITSAYITASGALEKTTRRIWAYLL